MERGDYTYKKLFVSDGKQMVVRGSDPETGPQPELAEDVPVLGRQDLPDADRQRARRLELGPERQPVDRMDRRDAAGVAATPRGLR